MTKPAHRGRNATQPLKKAFLGHLRRLHYLQPAADATGVATRSRSGAGAPTTRTSPRPTSVLEQTTEDLEAAAVRRATRRYEPSDTLLIFLLKARRPDVYRDRVDVRARVDATVDATVTHLDGVREQIRERLTRDDADDLARRRLGH